MAAEGLETANYVTYEENALPARYKSRQKQRGGKRRKTTLVKREKLWRKSLQLQDIQADEHPSEEKYKIPSDDSSASSVDENYEIDSIASSIPESLTWRGRMQVFLHSAWIHIIIVLLVVADAIIVIFELLLDVGAFGNLRCEGETLFEQKESCHYSRHDECGPSAKLILERLNISESPGTGTGVDGLCACKFRSGLRVCDDKDEPSGVNPAFVLHIASLLILTLFVVEILLKLIAFRLKYFTHKFEVFDGLVVCVSYILDWASLQEEEAFEAASLVIILRLWRVVRIVNGAVLSSKSRSDKQLSEARLKARTIVHAFHKAQDRLDVLEEENKSMKREVALGKAIHRPRGNHPAEHSWELGTQLADKRMKGTAHEREPPEQNNDERGSMPDIIVTEPAADSSDMYF